MKVLLPHILRGSRLFALSPNHYRPRGNFFLIGKVSGFSNGNLALLAPVVAACYCDRGDKSAALAIPFVNVSLICMFKVRGDVNRSGTWALKRRKRFMFAGK